MAWNTWTSDYYYTTSATTTTWTNWTDSTSSTTCYPTAGNYMTWKIWVSTDVTSDSTGTTWYQWIDLPTQRELTKEEKERHEQERIRMEQLAKEREEERKKEEERIKKAEEKALQLLLESLTKNQAEVFKATGAIPVECQSGKKYHIRKGIAQNVHELDEKGATKRRLCFHPTDCPVYDVMLAQKLMLEACEEEALRVANFS